MLKLWVVLQGWKTHIAAAGLATTAVAQALNGEVPPLEALGTVAEAAGLSSLRSAVAKFLMRVAGR